MKKVVHDILCILLVCVLTIALSLAIGQSFIKNENIFLLYVLAVIIVLIETKNIWYGTLVSIILIMSFNFFLTEPYYTFIVDDPNYLIMFVIFFIVSIIVGTLVIQLQKQIEISTKKERSIQTMYDFSKRFLNAHDASEIYPIVNSYIENSFGNQCYVVTKDFEVYGDLELNDEIKEAINYALNKNIIVGINEEKYSNLKYEFFPIRSKLYSFSVLIIKCEEKLKVQDIDFISNIVNELIVILDREKIIYEQELAKEKIATEKFKTSLLRSLSHDIKTPLTTIQSGSKFLLDSYSLLDEQSIKELISEIYDESLSLSEFVINLLNMSKLEETKTIMNARMESIDDIFSEVKSRISKFRTTKQIVFKETNEIYFVYSNIDLISLVITNLVDNAIKHTNDNAKIIIEAIKENDLMRINVIDNGGGIENNKIDKIFEDFYSLRSKGDYARSTGLGLSICKAIVDAHKGKIECFNNEIGGATFTFVIPIEGETNE